MMRPFHPRPTLALIPLATALAAAPARADTQADNGAPGRPTAPSDPSPADARAQASAYFAAGAQAFDDGQYLVAAEAFLKAHELLPSPALLFSAAQAYRRQTAAEPSPDTLRRAVALYREYLRADPKAKRREDAIKALEALAPLDARLPPGAGSSLTPIPYGAKTPDAASTDPAPPADRPTRVLLTALPQGAQVALDGGAFMDTPVVVHVAPGAHTVRVRAEGHAEAQTTLQAVAHELTPSHVVLQPKPARLHVVGNEGARVSIDGQVRATVPTAAPLALDPGAHFVTVTLSGHEPYAELIEVRRDQTLKLTVTLAPTPQRIVAWTVLGTGAAGAIAGGILGGLALARQGDAETLRDKHDSGVLSPVERDQYNRDVAARNDLGLAAALTGGAAALTLLTGATLYAFDNPEPPPMGDRPDAPAPAKPTVEFTVGALGFGLHGRF